MIFEDLHSRTILPLAFTVCGTQLLPMTVGHARAIEALGLWSPTTATEVLLAAFVCSRGHRKIGLAIHSRWTRWRLRWWAWRLGRKWNYDASIVHWRAFVAYHREEPLVTFKGSGGGMGMPWLTHIRAAACKGLGYDPMTFDDAPLAQVVLDYYAFAETEGAVNVVPMSTSQASKLRQRSA